MDKIMDFRKSARPMEAPIVRKAAAEDEPFLREMLYHSLFVPEGEKPFSRTILQDPAVSKYIEGWGRTGDIGYIALIRDVPVGSATARFFSRKNPGYGFIDESIPELGMAVLPEYRGRGIGTLLLRTLMQSLSDRGIGAVSLSVDVRNPAERLYERFGFYEVGTTGRSMTMRADLTDEGANHE